MSKIIFAYWKLRGLGQHLRLLLAYVGLDFQQVQYDNLDQWFKEDKSNFGFDFPNLPYLIDGQFKLTQSSAIATYIINRSGKKDLLGKNIEDQGKVQNLMGVFKDAYKDIGPLIYNKDYDSLKQEQLQKSRIKLDYIKNFVGDKPFALGYLTIVDFYLAEVLYHFETLYPNEKKNYAFWYRIRQNFEALPQIKSYYDRPDAIKAPLFSPYAVLSPSVPKVKLGYWGVRGRGQVPRLLLAYSGVQFQDFVYSDSSAWFLNDKFNLGLDFPNLPYLIDGQYNVTESSAIERYIIKRWGKTQLLGKNAQDAALIQSFLSIFLQISGEVKHLYFDKDYETSKVAIIQKYLIKLQQLKRFVGQKQFALGYLTLVDFVVAENSHYIQKLFPEEYKTLEFLERIKQNFNKLPEIEAYYEKPTAFKGRFLPESTYVQVPNHLPQQKA